MAARRLLLLAALLATGLLGRAASADTAASSGQISFVEQSPANPWHLVTLEAGDPQNIITVFDLPGAQVRVWMRMPDGTMAFAGSAVVGPTGHVSIGVPQAALIPGLPRYLVITETGPKNDMRDWLE